MSLQATPGGFFFGGVRRLAYSLTIPARRPAGEGGFAIRGIGQGGVIMYRRLVLILFAGCLGMAVLPAAAQPATTGQIKPRFWNGGGASKGAHLERTNRRYQREKQAYRRRATARRYALPRPAHVAAGTQASFHRNERQRRVRMRLRQTNPRFFNRAAPAGGARQLYIERWEKNQRRRPNRGTSLDVRKP